MMQTKLAAIKQRLDTVLGWVLVGIMALAVLNVLWQVFTRFILSDPSSFTDELARFLLIWIGLLGASYATGRNLHLAIDLVPNKMTGKHRAILLMVVETLVFVFALTVMFIGGIQLVFLQLLLGQTSPALNLPLGYVYLVLPLSGLLIMFYTALQFYNHLRSLHAT